MAQTVSEELAYFQSACDGGYKTARDAAAAGVNVAGYMCSYSPQELLHAAGYFPVRVLGRLGATPQADAVMQSFICSFARSAFDAALSNEYDFIKVMLFAHTCDTMQNLADLWQGNCPGMKTVITALPNVHAGSAASTYYRQELDRVRKEIEAISGLITDTALRASIQLYDTHRERMRELYTLRYLFPLAITGTEMMTVVLSSFLTRRENHLEHLQALIQTIKAANDSDCQDARHLPKVIVGGSVCQAIDFIATIEAAGCRVVGDDLCMGSRSFLVPPSVEHEDPIEALMQAYLTRPPCPAIYKPDFDPAALMLERVRETNANGVVFLITKFCDPYLFDYPHVNDALEAAGIPALMIEVEQNLPVSEQLKTRMEAFAEVLQARKGAQA